MLFQPLAFPMLCHFAFTILGRFVKYHFDIWPFCINVIPYDSDLWNICVRQFRPLDFWILCHLDLRIFDRMLFRPFGFLSISTSSFEYFAYRSKVMSNFGFRSVETYSRNWIWSRSIFVIGDVWWRNWYSAHINLNNSILWGIIPICKIFARTWYGLFFFGGGMLQFMTFRIMRFAFSVMRKDA